MQTSFAVDPLVAELSLRGGVRLVLVTALGLIASAAVGVMYVLEVGRTSFLARAFSATVRMGVVVLVAFLLLRPVWVRDVHGEKRRPVAVLIDASQSMENKDPRPGLADQWRVAFA